MRDRALRPHIWMAIFALLALVLIPACETTVPSPYTGKQVTADEMLAEKAQAEKEAKEEAEAAFKEARILAIEARRQQAQGNAAAEATIAKAEAIAETAGKTLNIRLESIERQADAGLKAIESKNAAIVGGLNLAAGTASNFGPIGVLAGGLLSGVAGLYGVRQRARAQNAETAAARIVDSIDVLKVKAPEVAAAFKANEKLLREWQGEAVTNFVTTLQTTPKV